MSNCIRICDAANAVGQWLYDWQTLLTGMLALAGACLTVRKIRDQIDQVDRHEVARLNRHHRAVRATMPLTLSGLCRCLKEMLVALDRVKTEISKKDQPEFAGKFDLPPPPTQYIEEIQEIIATTDEPSVVAPLAHVVREIQTLWARVEVFNEKCELSRRVCLEKDANSWILRSAEIYALVESLFDYARSDSDSGPGDVSWERVEAVIFRLGIEDKALVDAVEKGLEKSPNFWALS